MSKAERLLADIARIAWDAEWNGEDCSEALDAIQDRMKEDGKLIMGGQGRILGYELYDD